MLTGRASNGHRARKKRKREHREEPYVRSGKRSLFVSSISLGKFTRLVLVCALAFSPVSYAQQVGLTRVLALARQNDPTYLGAQAKLRASRERSSQATSYVLPQLAVKGGYNRNDRRYETIGGTFPVPVSESQYNGYNAQLSLTQPLWQHSSLIGMSQARIVVSQSEHEVKAAEQDLLLRLAKAWFEALGAADLQVHAEARAVATRLQWDQLRKASSIDLAANPELEDARAKFEQAMAERIASASELEAKRAALEEVVGPLPETALPALSRQYVPPTPDGTTEYDWIRAAEEQNPSVLAARAAFEAAGMEVRRQRSGHEPTLSLVGSYGLNNQGEGNFPGQSGYDIRLKSIGVEISIPLYQGGLQSAKVGEAVALRSQAEQEMQQALRSARSAAKTAWYLWQAGSARHRAALQSVKSSTVALRFASLATEREIKFDLDVLQAREQLLDNWTRLQQSQYDTVLAWMRLKAASGQLTDADFASLEPAWVARDTEAQTLTASSN